MSCHRDPWLNVDDEKKNQDGRLIQVEKSLGGCGEQTKKPWFILYGWFGCSLLYKAQLSNKTWKWSEFYKALSLDKHFIIKNKKYRLNHEIITQMFSNLKLAEFYQKSDFKLDSVFLLVCFCIITQSLRLRVCDMMIHSISWYFMTQYSCWRYCVYIKSQFLFIT